MNLEVAKRKKGMTDDFNEDINAHENREIYGSFESPIRASTPDDRGDYDPMVNIDIYFFN